MNGLQLVPSLAVSLCYDAGRLSVRWLYEDFIDAMLKKSEDQARFKTS
jgi:hypothetical protein